jgi:hypothetical protein
MLIIYKGKTNNSTALRLQKEEGDIIKKDGDDYLFPNPVNYADFGVFNCFDQAGNPIEGEQYFTQYFTGVDFTGKVFGDIWPEFTAACIDYMETELNFTFS